MRCWPSQVTWTPVLRREGSDMCHSDGDEAEAFHDERAPYYELVKAAA